MFVINVLSDGGGGGSIECWLCCRVFQILIVRSSRMLPRSVVSGSVFIYLSPTSLFNDTSEGLNTELDVG